MALAASFEPQAFEPDDDSAYDIFENSSPQRPLEHAGDTRGTVSVGDVVASAVNSSRKRAHNRTSSTGSVLSMASPAGNVNNGLKRHRSEHWRRDAGIDTENFPPNTDSVNTTLSPARPSKFLEASMHDRPSEKPPSLFLRAIDKYAKKDNMENLMEEYENEARAPSRPSARNGTQAKGLTQHPNISISSAATGDSAATAESRQSGIFRFGRSIVSSFNPLNVFRGVSTQWNAAREELIEEKRVETEVQKKRQQMKEQAEHKYAELKRMGQLGKQGTVRITASVFTPGYTAAVPDGAHNRDSGIDVDEGDIMDEDIKWAPIESIENKPKRKSSFHFRTPSLSNLRKIASSSNLHRRASSSSMSPEKQTQGGHELVRSVSKHDLAKQAKLQRRVSDLEAKLEAARRELHKTMDQAPPVPPLPPKYAGVSSKPKHKRNPLHKAFAPLPSLPSERLIAVKDEPTESDIVVRDFAEDITKTVPEPEPYDEFGNTVSEAEGFMEDQYSEKPLPEPVNQDSNFSTFLATKVAEQGTFSNPTSSPVTSDREDILKQAPRKKMNNNNKKRKSGGDEDLSFRPGSEEDDAEWALAARAKKFKKKRSDDVSGSPISQHDTTKTDKKPAKASKPAPSTAAHAPPRVCPRPSAAKQRSTVIPKKLPALPALATPVLPGPPTTDAAAAEPSPRTSLDTVPEETASVVSVKLASAPTNPTAIKTPAHPSGIPRGVRGQHQRTRSMSPSKMSGPVTVANNGSPLLDARADGSASPERGGARVRGVEDGASGAGAATPALESVGGDDEGDYRRESPSPSPSPRKRDGEIVKAKPVEKDVPHVPDVVVVAPKKEEWTWPDDVF